MADILFKVDRNADSSDVTLPAPMLIPSLCQEVLAPESLSKYTRYKIRKIHHFKERTQVGHEFIILDVFDSSDRASSIHRLRAERRPSRRKADKVEDDELPGPPPSGFDMLVTAALDTIKRVPETKVSQYNSEMDSLGYLLLERHLSFPEACRFFDQIVNSAWFYTLFRRQCYWFCITFIRRVQRYDSHSRWVPGLAASREGAPGYGCLPAIFRPRVAKREDVDKDIEEEVKERKERLEGLEQVALEEVRQKMAEVLKERQQERAESSDRLRHWGALANVRTAEEQRRADTETLQARFSRKVKDTGAHSRPESS